MARRGRGGAEETSPRLAAMTTYGAEILESITFMLNYVYAIKVCGLVMLTAQSSEYVTDLLTHQSVIVVSLNAHAKYKTRSRQSKLVVIALQDGEVTRTKNE